MKTFIRTSAVLACIMLLPMMASAESNSSQLNRMRLENGRALVEVDSVNWSTVVPYYTNDIEYHDPIVTIQGIDEMTEFLSRLFTSSPNLVTTVEDEICIDDTYTAAWTMTGYFNGVPYTAKGMSIIKFRPKESQAYYQRDYYSEGDIMINITGGFAEPVEAFRQYYRCAVDPDPAFVCPFYTIE
ncbi:MULTISPECIES: nuclear transport factor 2 family protein [Desulfosediminicola]|uniref:nuclear transport factor 2 family protein n=1 Tax=Desulfosediminicola TaxID=2886823 RepID=UPI0010ABEC25|nr:nuclear transport factor 2 family protein [Desulfosediminicola ganghwensis]